MPTHSSLPLGFTRDSAIRPYQREPKRHRAKKSFLFPSFSKTFNGIPGQRGGVCQRIFETFKDLTSAHVWVVDLSSHLSFLDLSLWGSNLCSKLPPPPRSKRERRRRGGGVWIDKRTIRGERKSLLEKMSAERGKTVGWNGGGGRTDRLQKSERRAKLQQKEKRKCPVITFYSLTELFDLKKLFTSSGCVLFIL